MRLATWNLNGIRAAYKKGLDQFIKKMDADVLLFRSQGCRTDAGGLDPTSRLQCHLAPGRKKGTQIIDLLQR